MEMEFNQQRKEGERHYSNSFVDLPRLKLSIVTSSNGFISDHVELEAVGLTSIEARSSLDFLLDRYLYHKDNIRKGGDKNK